VRTFEVDLEELAVPDAGEGARYGERTMDFHVFIRVWRHRARRRWEVNLGDPHADHHVTIGIMPEESPEGRWYVYSTHGSDHRVWLYPGTAGARWRVGRLRRLRPGLGWTEVPPTPYDADLGTLPDDDTPIVDASIVDALADDHALTSDRHWHL
jgi:hypothetical protein